MARILASVALTCLLAGCGPSVSSSATEGPTTAADETTAASDSEDPNDPAEAVIKCAPRRCAKIADSTDLMICTLKQMLSGEPGYVKFQGCCGECAPDDYYLVMHGDGELTYVAYLGDGISPQTQVTFVRGQMCSSEVSDKLAICESEGCDVCDIADASFLFTDDVADVSELSCGP